MQGAVNRLRALHLLLINQVNKTTGCRNNNIHPPVQRLLLWRIRSCENEKAILNFSCSTLGKNNNCGVESQGQIANKILKNCTYIHRRRTRHQSRCPQHPRKLEQLAAPTHEWDPRPEHEHRALGIKEYMMRNNKREPFMQEPSM